MAKNKNNWIIILIIIGIVFVFGMTQINNPIFATLPPGQNNHNADCSFVTNIQTINSINDYDGHLTPSEQLWIAVDINNDGIKETLVFKSWYSSPLGTSFCDGNYAAKSAVYLTQLALGNFKMKYRNSSEELFICFDNIAKSYIKTTVSGANLDCSETCTPSWQCSSWSACNSGTQTRTCTDSNNCGITTGKPTTIQSCGTVCTESWTCGSWSACSDGTQTRTCTDSNNCGTTVSQPSSSQTCNGTFDFGWLNDEVFKIGDFIITWLYLIIGIVGLIIILMLIK